MMSDTFNIIERAIWAQTWLALREFRADAGQGGVGAIQRDIRGHLRLMRVVA